MAKTPNKRSVPVNKIPPAPKLLDGRAAPKSSDPVSRTILFVLAAGLLVVGMALGYFLYFYNPVTSQNYTPQIIVPDAAEEEKEEAEAEAPAPAETVKQTVQIQDTPTGFLNVRKGAGTNFAKIGQVKPGESYELVSQTAANGGWLEIRLDATTTGWVSSQYAKVK